MKENSYKLPDNFTDIVMREISHKQALKESKKESLLMCLYVVASLGAALSVVFALYYFNFISLDFIHKPTFDFAFAKSIISRFVSLLDSFNIPILIGINLLILYAIGETLAKKNVSLRQR